MKRMRRNAWLALALTGLAAVHALVLFAGFFSPYHPATQARDFPFAPPTRLHFVDAGGHFHLRPFVYGLTSRDGTFGEYEEDRGRSYPVAFFVTGTPYRVAGLFDASAHLFGVKQPGNIFLLGTDNFGRDQFSRLLYGGQVSLAAGLLATLLALGLAVLLGTVAGYFGWWADEPVMRFAELFMALPWLYLVFALRAFLPLHLSPVHAFLLVVAVIGTVGWARPARLVRGIVLAARQQDFVRAAKGFGAPSSYIIRRHVLPQTAGVVLTQAALLLPQFIMAEVTLSFLGLGISEPVPSWGTMLTALQHYYVLESYWWMAAPVLLLMPTLWLYIVLADELHDRTHIFAR
jgi:peptide/nickel transport system permease protein